MTSHSKTTEILSLPALATSWLSVADYREYIVAAVAGDVSPLNGVTIQLRKATSSGGANAANQGDAVTFDDAGYASLNVEDLGETGGGVQYTHVSATVTDQDSPNTVTALAFRAKPRFTR